MQKAALAISSFVITVAVAIRLLIVSDYQIPTALGVASSSNAVSTLIGTIMPLVGTFLPIALQIFAALAVLAALTARFALAFRLLAATTLSFFAALLVSPPLVSLDTALQYTQNTAQNILLAGDRTLPFLLFLIVLLLSHIQARYGGQGRYTRDRAFIVLTVGGTLIYVVFAFASVSYPLPSEVKNVPAALRRVWLPTESIQMKDGSRRIGYVLSTDKEWTVILEDSPRTVQQFRSDEVRSRTICRVDTGPDKLPHISNVKRPPGIMPCGPAPG